MELKGSKTEANLWKAFAGESMARNKYTYFASKAKKEGFEQIAAIFEETAGNEKEHAKMWFKELQGIGSTADNLLSAAEGGKRAVQNVLVQPQAVQLPQEHPLLLPRDPFQQDLPGRPLRLRHQAWKIDGAVWPGEDSAAGQAPLQQTEQSCLAPAIAAHKPQFPAGVQLKVQVLKDGDVVPLIGKGKILNGDL